jgi:UDP-N-acetylmuramate dehydrogenase
MNAGGHGSDTASVLVEAIIVDLKTAMLSVRSAAGLDLAYRHSNVVDSEIVVQATFATTSGDPAAIEDTIRSITRWRREHQPGGTLNAGSVFKNPSDEAAGAIIERCGLKGSSSGAVGMSDVHANFLVATPDASAFDIYRFVFETRDAVRRLTGISLEPEIRFLGSFDPEVQT